MCYDEVANLRPAKDFQPITRSAAHRCSYGESPGEASTAQGVRGALQEPAGQAQFRLGRSLDPHLGRLLKSQAAYRPGHVPYKSTPAALQDTMVLPICSLLPDPVDVAAAVQCRTVLCLASATAGAPSSTPDMATLIAGHSLFRAET